MIDELVEDGRKQRQIGLNLTAVHIISFVSWLLACSYFGLTLGCLGYDALV